MEQIKEQLVQLGEMRAEIEAEVIGSVTYEQMIRTLPVGVVVINDVGRILLVNEAFETIFGYTAPMIEGQLVHVLLPPELVSKHPGFVEGFFDRPGRRPMSQGRELPARRANGKRIMVRIDIGPLSTSKGWLAMATIHEVIQPHDATTPGLSG
jgi:protein-histidine pros-kinase